MSLSANVDVTESAYPNRCVKVDDHVWRGARPTADQARRLELIGVRSALDLEWEQSDAGLWSPGVTQYRIRDIEFLPSLLPEIADQHVLRALRFIRSAESVCYVHCRSGQNRTGVVVAAYRLIERGDPLDHTLVEFFSLGGLWQNPDTPYIRSLYDRRETLKASI